MEKIYGDLFHSLTVKILEIKDTPIKDISENTFEGVIASGMEVRPFLKYVLVTKGQSISKANFKVFI